MSSLKSEIANNAAAFLEGLNSEIGVSLDKPLKGSGQFLKAYQTAVSLQAWREFVFEPRFSLEAVSFFVEAQNDALLSLSTARMGLWRPALQCLRSSAENVLAALYYAQHEVELRLWEAGKHRLAFKNYCEYFKSHPDFFENKRAQETVDHLRRDLMTLSKAVHASQISFRMTGSTFPCLFDTTISRLNVWDKRYQETLGNANLMLICFFRDSLCGPDTRQLRKCLGIILDSRVKAWVKRDWQVNLPD